MGTEESFEDRVIPSSTLATLRGILISSLSRENLGDMDVVHPPPRRRRKVTFEEHEAGAAPVDASRHPASANTAARAASNKDSNRLGTDGALDGASQRTSASITDQGKDGGGLSQKEREDRLRNLRDRQIEERQRKLDELRSQALAAQKFREQKEEERRRRVEELRLRDNDRRYQVEERKRQIWEAERDRREAILRKNQEREARVDTKRRNERSSIVFAFGSSTPRMLEPADTGGSFWGTRRATSTTNVMMFSAATPLTRRSSERELDGSKKRAASASGLDRKPEEGAADDVDATPGYVARVNRKRTDLMPTIPSPRDTTPSRPPSAHPQSRPFSRSPGRAFSMSRLDQLSKPRRQPMREIVEKAAAADGGGKSLGAAPSSVSRSMSHLVAGGEGKPRAAALRKTDSSRSMSQLAAAPPVPPPRPTRAERLRRRAREVAISREKGLRSGEVTPSPPSRPLSSMSQQSITSVNSGGVSLRPRPAAAPRKPRPFSIAVTGVTQEHDQRPAAYRHSISGEIRTSKAMASSVERIDNAKPPLPKPHVTKKPITAHPKPDTPARRVTDRAVKSAKASPRATPKATPLQSPGTETAPPIIHAPQIIPAPITFEQPDTKKETKVDEVKAETTAEAHAVVVEPGPTSVDVVKEGVILEPREEEAAVKVVEEQAKNVQEVPIQPIVVEVKPAVVEVKPAVVEVKPAVVEVKPAVVDVKPAEKVIEKAVDKVDIVMAEKVDEEVDMTASMMAKTRISTEEQAKAALAERRRLAREQAEREAEAERQRVEREREEEEERLRLEEEEQVRFEEEQLRLVEAARKAEEERLLIAIQENEKQQEEDRKRREEDAKAKIEREEADKKAREEAEKQRQENELRLKKEEEERVTRRKRVEAIMLRTRGKGNTPANTPTKDGDSEGDEVKDGSPTDNAKSDEMSQSVILMAASADNLVGNGHNGDVRENGGGGGEKTAMTLSTSASSELLLIDNTNGRAMEISDEDISERPMQHSNGHRNGVEYNNSVDFVNVDNMKQYKPSNNLLDFSEFETLSNEQSSTSTTDLEQIMTPTSGKFINEDNVNSNINAPFIAFSDNLTKRQDSNTVTDLLS